MNYHDDKPSNYLNYNYNYFDQFRETYLSHIYLNIKGIYQYKMATNVDQQSSNDINLMNLIESRIVEILQIENDARRKKPKLFSQRLPRFMRRRAACHNVKRLPYRIRMNTQLKVSPNASKKLVRYRRRLRFRKHKRILRKHAKPNYPKDPWKCLLHKWFAKRFKMAKDEPWCHVPMYNNTKNQRNLQRQTIYGCAFISMAHLVSIQLDLCKPTKDNKYILINQLETLNQLAREASGFTFCSRALESGRYETIVKMFDETKEFICEAIVFLTNYKEEDVPSILTLWVPRKYHSIIKSNLERISSACRQSFCVKTIMPKDSVRFRLLGPDARERALQLISKGDLQDVHKLTMKEADIRCKSCFKYQLGRHIEGQHISCTYYNTKPRAVDIIVKGPEGRLLFHKLIKHKAHLVGGYRDYDRLINN